MPALRPFIGCVWDGTTTLLGGFINGKAQSSNPSGNACRALPAEAYRRSRLGVVGRIQKREAGISLLKRVDSVAAQTDSMKTAVGTDWKTALVTDGLTAAHRENGPRWRLPDTRKGQPERQDVDQHRLPRLWAFCRRRVALVCWAKIIRQTAIASTNRRDCSPFRESWRA